MSEADAAAGVNIRGDRNATTTTHSDTLRSSGAAVTTTTRQRRIQLQYHSTNGLWEQPQPRIKKASQREAAYLRASGLVPTSKSKKVDDTSVTTGTILEKSTKENDDVTRHFARQLGSTDARIRHQTIRQLKAYLKVRSDVKNDGLSEMDMIKLWKCFWYTLYLADRVPVQEELCQQLCSLIWSVAGTAEQDEYIGQVYLDSISGLEEDAEYDQEDDDNEDIDDREDDEEDMDFCKDEGCGGCDGCEDDDGDEIDFEAKQLALLEEEEDDDDDEEEDMDELNNDAVDDDEFNNDAVDGDDADDAEEDGEGDDEDEGNPMDDRHCQGAHLAALFVRTFWRTCVREWGKMDKYRVDKFYTCLRYMLAAMYDYMALRHWSLGIIHLFNDALNEEVLLKVPNGVRYHIVDCCVEELCKATQRSGGIPLTEATFIDVMEPFFALAQTGDNDDPLQQRVMEQVLLKFLNQYSVYSESYVKRQKEDHNKGKVQKDELVFDQVHVGTISKFIFEIAADDAVARDEFRKSLYSVHKQYERRIREVGPEYDVDIDGDGDMQDEFENDEVDYDSPDDMEDDDTEEEVAESSSSQKATKSRTSHKEKKGSDGSPSAAVKAKDTTKISHKEKKVGDGPPSTAEKEKDTTKVSHKEKKVSDGSPSAAVKQKDTTKVSHKQKKVGDGPPSTAVKQKDATKVDTSDTKLNDTTNCDKSSTKVKKMNKAKKKKQSNLITAAYAEPLSEKKEEVIIISKADQKAARAAMDGKIATPSISKKRRTDPSTGNGADVEGGTKRVKFGDSNRARSYQASMNGLTKLEVKPILQKSPERSILLKSGNKNKIIAIHHPAQKAITTQRPPPRGHNNAKNNRHRGKLPGRK